MSKTIKVLSKLHKNSYFVILFYLLVTIIVFSPIFFSDWKLSKGDAVLYNKPIYQQEIQLWNKYIFLGYPGYADPQVATFFPIKVVSQLLKFDFDIYVLGIFIIGSVGTYLFIYLLTSKKLPSVLSGLFVAFSLPLMQHIVHTNLLYSFVFFPWILYSIKAILRFNQKRYFLLLVTSVAFSILAGHIQISLYIIILASIYTLFSLKIYRAKISRILLIFVLIVLGIGLSAVQIVPSLNLYSQTPREKISFYDFNSFTHSLKTIVTLFYPFVLGGDDYVSGEKNPLSESKSFGPWGFAELSGFIGAFTIFMLVYLSVSIKTKDERKEIRFWSTLIVILVMFMITDFTILREVLYKIPLLNLFRSQGRLILFIQFFITILFSYGVKTLLGDLETNNRKEIFKKLLKSTVITVVFYSLTLLLVVVFRDDYVKMALEKGVIINSFSPINNIAIRLPLILFVITSLFLFTIILIKKRWVTIVLLSILTILEIFPIVLNSQLTYYSPGNGLRNCSDDRLSQNIVVEKKRVLVWDGVFSNLLPPNTNIPCKISSFNGYNPLVLNSYIKNTGSNSVGTIDTPEKLLKDNKYLLNYYSIEDIVINSTNTGIIEMLVNNGLIIKYAGSLTTILENPDSKEIIFTPKYIKSYNEVFQSFLNKDVLNNDTIYINKNINFSENNLSILNTESLNSNNILITVNPIKEKGLVSTSIMNYKGWIVSFKDENGLYVGDNNEIIESNGAFISFVVPENVKYIKLSFEPIDFKLGLMITIISLLIMIFMLCRNKFLLITKFKGLLRLLFF